MNMKKKVNFTEAAKNSRRRVRTFEELDVVEKKGKNYLSPDFSRIEPKNYSRFSPMRKTRNEKLKEKLNQKSNQKLKQNSILLNPISKAKLPKFSHKHFRMKRGGSSFNKNSSIHKSSSNSVKSSIGSRVSEVSKKGKKTSVFQFDSAKLKEKLGLIDEEEKEASKKTNFFQIVNVLKKTKKDKKNENAYQEKIERLLTKQDLVGVINAKEKEIKNLRKIIEHMRIGIETRETTIMKLNQELKTIKDLVSLEIGKFKKNEKFQKKREEIEKEFERKKKEQKSGEKAKSKMLGGLNETFQREKNLQYKVSDIFTSNQKLRSHDKSFIQNSVNFSIIKFSENDYYSKILKEFSLGENALKQISKFIRVNTKKSLMIFRSLKENYLSKISAIAFLQNLTSRFTQLGTMNIIQLSKHVMKDLSELIHCEKSQILFYNKIGNTFFFSKHYKKKSQELDLVSLDPECWLVRELINGQDLKHTEVDDDKKDIIQGKFGDRLGIKITGYLSTKIIQKDKLLGVLLCFNKKVHKKNFHRISSTKNYTQDELSLIRIYRNAIASTYDRSISIYFFDLKNRAINHIFDASTNIIEAPDLATIVKRGETILREIFNTKHSKIVLIKNGKFLQLQKKKNQKILPRLKFVDTIKEGGIFYEVFEKKKERFSQNTRNDHIYNYHCDIDTNLPSLTYPILDTESKNIIAIFQISLWQETFRNFEENGVNFTNEIFKDFAEVFSKFFGFVIKFHDGFKVRKILKNERRRSKKPNIYEVARMKMISKRIRKKYEESKKRNKFLSVKNFNKTS